MMLPPMMVASGTCNKELYRNKRCDAPLRIDSSGAGNMRYAVSKLTDDNSKQKANVREGFLAMLETCFPEARSGDGKAAGDRSSGTGAAHAGAGTGGNGPEYHFTPEMSEEEAKAVIRDDPNGNIIKRLTAIAVAKKVLGENCTMKEIWKWAESDNN